RPAHRRGGGGAARQAPVRGRAGAARASWCRHVGRGPRPGARGCPRPGGGGRPRRDGPRPEPGARGRGKSRVPHPPVPPLRSRYDMAGSAGDVRRPGAGGGLVSDPRRVLLMTHPSRPEALEVAIGVAERLAEAGIEVRVPAGEIADSILGQHPLSVVHDDVPPEEIELVVVLGGDGTILRGAEVARRPGVPVLGVNLGHVGFLAEAEREDIDATVEHIVDRDYRVEERMTLDVVATLDGREIARSWALNEVTVEKASRERMLVLTAEIDGRPLSTWGCDGVVMATPTGSTAY